MLRTKLPPPIDRLDNKRIVYYDRCLSRYFFIFDAAGDDNVSGTNRTNVRRTPPGGGGNHRGTAGDKVWQETNMTFLCI